MKENGDLICDPRGCTTLFNPLVYGGQSGEFIQGVHARASRKALAILC